MKTEIEFCEPSRLIPYLIRNGHKLTHLNRYPTSRNAVIWHSYSSSIINAHTLVSYDEVPAVYYESPVIGNDEIRISIAPNKLTPTTRRHIYAFIRQYVPSKQAETIINTARKAFSLSPMSKDEHNKPIYEMQFDIYPE